MFVYKVDRQIYGKVLEHMENNLLQRKDPSPKTVADACRILAGLKNRYGVRDSFPTTGEEGTTKYKKGDYMLYSTRNGRAS